MLAAALSCAALAHSQGDKKPAEEDSEVKLGRSNAAELEKTLKIVTDPALVGRVNRIGQEIAAIANSVEVPAIWGTSSIKKFDYVFKVIEDKDVNAFSLPGGFIYVHTGLLEYVRSDDELAGVLAHEVAHASHRHMMKLIAEQNRLQQRALLPLLAAALLTKSPGANIPNLLMAGNLYMVAKLNTYGQEAERDADQAGVLYLKRTKYNPVGILTFMERLARDELRRPNVELGIYRTHPPSPERAQALLAQLEQLKIAINRRDVDPSIRAVVQLVKMNGRDVAEVSMSRLVIGRFAAFDGRTAEERARISAGHLNEMFDSGVQMVDIRSTSDKSKIYLRNVLVMQFTSADSEAVGVPVAEMGSAALQILRNLVWQEQNSRISGAAGGGVR
jgi:predicted Zn-dependent protease